jgi:enoyl-CoA hydratase/carnithine racemase
MGYLLNRALPPAELGPFVEQLAARIASFPATAIALAKAAVNAADPTIEAGLCEEAHLFNLTLATPAARTRMARFMAVGGQTPEVEKGIGPLLERLLSE